MQIQNKILTCPYPCGKRNHNVGMNHIITRMMSWLSLWIVSFVFEDNCSTVLVQWFSSEHIIMIVCSVKHFQTNSYTPVRQALFTLACHYIPQMKSQSKNRWHFVVRHFYRTKHGGKYLIHLLCKLLKREFEPITLKVPVIKNRGQDTYWHPRYEYTDCHSPVEYGESWECQTSHGLTSIKRTVQKRYWSD